MRFCFFLSGCETTTLRRRFFVACRLLFFATTRARERERQTDRERERHVFIFFRDDDAFRVFSKRAGLKRASSSKRLRREKDDREKRRQKTSPMEYNYPSRVRGKKRSRDRETEESYSRHKKSTLHSYLVFAGASRLDDAHFSWFRSHFVCV